jgi:hypothetical protein
MPDVFNGVPANQVTVYRLNGTTGWGATWGGMPVVAVDKWEVENADDVIGIVEPMLEPYPTTNEVVAAIANSGHLPASATNGWEVGSHVGLATAGAVAAVQAEVGSGTNWLTRTGLSGTVAFANDAGRPQAWSGTGALTVSGFSGLQPPSQVYWTMSGFDSVTLPANVYAVGGGSWQTNMVNHFTLWQTGTNVLMSFITATED